jgi:OHCU decarboxylase
MPRALFVEHFGDIFEHTPAVAARAHAKGLGPQADTAAGLHAALISSMHAMSRDEKLALICAHPDLAGRLAQAKQLTSDSSVEQASAGLDLLTPAELARFTTLNTAYTTRFGFPFIYAVKGRTKSDILAAFDTRLKNDAATEFDEALRQIERITLLRLTERMS